MKCPFCNEDDFDAIGLKAHLLQNQCDVFPHILSPEEERRQRDAAPRRSPVPPPQEENSDGAA